MLLNLRIMIEKRSLGHIIRVQFVDLLEYCSRTWLQKMPPNTSIPPSGNTTPQVVREEAVAAVVDLAPKIQVHCPGN
jgi:hypothetical protein